VSNILWVQNISGALPAIARYKADTLGLSNGAAVTTIPDSTGQQPSFGSAFGSVTYVTAAQNGLGVVDIAAAGGMLLSWTYVRAQPVTIYLAAKLQSTGSGNNMVIGGVQWYMTGTGYDINAGLDLVRGTQDQVFHVFTWLLNGSSSLCRIDGVQQGAIGNAGSNGLAVSSDNLAGQVPWRLGEIVVTAGDTLAGGEETALRTKWGV